MEDNSSYSGDAYSNSSNIALRVREQMCSEKTLQQTVHAVSSDKNSAMQTDKNRMKSDDQMKRTPLRWVLKQSGGSWKTSTAGVFCSRFALGKKV